MSVFIMNYSSGDQITENEMGGACGMCGEKRNEGF